MKKIIALTVMNCSLLFAQFSYPAEDFLGGGIGYSPMYIKLDSIPGASYLKNLGLDPENFSDPFVIHGGEGYRKYYVSWWEVSSYRRSAGR